MRMVPSRKWASSLTCALCLFTIIGAPQTDARRAGGTRGLVEPLFAYDDIEANPPPPQSAPIEPPPQTATKPPQARILPESIQQKDTPPKQVPSSPAASKTPPLVPLVALASTTPRVRKWTEPTVTPLVAGATAPTTTGAPKHWSALENYYNKLRANSAQSRPNDDGQLAFDPGLYLLRRDPGELSLALAGQQHNQQQQQQVLLSPGGGGGGGGGQLFEPRRANQFELLALQQRLLEQLAQQVATPTKGGSSAFDLPLSLGPQNSDASEFGFRSGGRGGGSSYPGVSRTGATKTATGHHHQVVVPSGEPVALRPPSYEMRNLFDLLLIRQQQERARHQLDTLGPLFELGRTREQLRDEAYCGPRNYVNYQLGLGGRATHETAASGKTAPPSEAQLQALLLTELRLRHQLPEVPVRLASPDFPSHAAILLTNSSNPTTTGAEHTHLCGATWVHEAWVLTAASCVAQVDPRRLLVRLGEWQLGRTNNDTTTTNNNKLPASPAALIRAAKRVVLFPAKNQPEANEHNLALVELDRPPSFLELPFVSPACQMHSRNSVRATTCWSPVRQVHTSEYFDAEGEGELKERRTVTMAEQQVDLYPHDPVRCLRPNRVDFHFSHPNYICSADVRKSITRLRPLNQTENFGSGIYCNENGNLELVSMLHPVHLDNPSSMGYLDLSYYRPWIRNVTSGFAY